jgi:hypothetical protein
VSTESQTIEPNHEVDMDSDRNIYLDRPLRFLKPEEISMIDQLLSDLDSQEELRLVIQKGRLRFVTKTRDLDENEPETLE